MFFLLIFPVVLSKFYAVFLQSFLLFLKEITEIRRGNPGKARQGRTTYFIEDDFHFDSIRCRLVWTTVLVLCGELVNYILPKRWSVCQILLHKLHVHLNGTEELVC